jgi:hypothetical protein
MKKRRLKRGPHEERLKISGDWEHAVGKALKKKRPKRGWPDKDKKTHKSS